MKLVFVRHAEPDYAVDSLTEKGRWEAELLSRRLCKLEDVSAFYVSPLGRAQATAAYTLDKLGRTAETLPWLAEFRGHCADTETGASRIPWDFKPRLWQAQPVLRDFDHWTEADLVQGGDTAQIWQETQQGLDALLARHGYHRDGGIYRCDNNQPDTIVLFCHFAIMAAMVAHLTGISPLNMWQGFCAQPSSVTTMITEERVKGEVIFRCVQFGDVSHLYAGAEPHSTAGLYPECYTGRDSTNPPEWEGHCPSTPVRALP
ncbi:MAG: histidine phosphatase family protein [Clostridia bacterium]|nr:histidine phosphatase family protein [Clostridia bacterium]